ncbi:hypothetical protein J31TS4_20130 [Paenibacillus sp. J31TS4]|uniref:DUF2062 domain-containing protein n=1 Tax=Paenibacillus sp. J31TS4 TaxID=2807195 RepID=UPI001B1F3277|nr:DUF2062 domain-containing protein [Paenibacillus sp. J31TS4]GIP38733.1 hypothetical protein J31TS4_20130 [Paenibacillus sp. J31TS4]
MAQANRVLANPKPWQARLAGIRRWFTLKYLLLLRAKGGPSMVAKGFSIGLAIEMFTLPTFGVAFVLIFPFVYLLRASLPGALIGFLFGKIIYIPMAFLNQKVGRFVLPRHIEDYLYFLPDKVIKLLAAALDLIVGGMIVGAVLGLIAYFPLRQLLALYTAKRKERRRLRHAGHHALPRQES